MHMWGNWTMPCCPDNTCMSQVKGVIRRLIMLICPTCPFYCLNGLYSSYFFPMQNSSLLLFARTRVSIGAFQLVASIAVVQSHGQVHEIGFTKDDFPFLHNQSKGAMWCIVECTIMLKAIKSQNCPKIYILCNKSQGDMCHDS